MDATNGLFAEFAQEGDIITIDVMEAVHSNTAPDDWVCPRCWNYGNADVMVNHSLFSEEDMELCGEDDSSPVVIFCNQCQREQEPLRIYALDCNRKEIDVWYPI